MSPAEIDAMTPAIIAPPEERNYAGERKILQKDIMKMKKSTGESVKFDYKWLDIEEHYRHNGWIVSYDKPAYCESYDAFFIFKPK